MLLVFLHQTLSWACARLQIFWKKQLGVFTGNELNRVYADNKRPIIWIATQRDGLNAYNYNKQVFTAYSHNPDDPHSLITNDVTDIAPSAQHEDGLWISTYYRGIEYLDINSGQFTHYNKNTVPALSCEQTWTVLDTGVCPHRVPRPAAFQRHLPVD